MWGKDLHVGAVTEKISKNNTNNRRRGTVLLGKKRGGGESRGDHHHSRKSQNKEDPRVRRHKLVRGKRVSPGQKTNKKAGDSSRKKKEDLERHEKRGSAPWTPVRESKHEGTRKPRLGRLKKLR